MRTALIGYTGFVGGNIAAQQTFTDYYNSKNIQDIKGKEYDLVVSAANRAEMWRINQDPAPDKKEIDEFIEHIRTVKAKQFVLISTVGVYKKADGVNEDTVIDQDGLTPYGIHRYHLEQVCAELFNATIVRLPGLFGDGLKKNVIYDLLHDNQLEKIHKDGVYQYYYLENIWKDIEWALARSIPLINLATEPVSTEEVAKECFHIDFTNTPADITPAQWDMRSKYAQEFSGNPDYLYDKQTVLQQIAEWIKKEGWNK